MARRVVPAALAVALVVLLPGCVSYGWYRLPEMLTPPPPVEGQPGYFGCGWLVRRAAGEFGATVCSMSVVWKVHGVCGVGTEAALVAGSTLVPIEGRGGEMGDRRAYLGLWRAHGQEVWGWVDDDQHPGLALTDVQALAAGSGGTAWVVGTGWGRGDLLIGRVVAETGEWLWRRTYGIPTAQEYFPKVIATADGGAVVACRRVETGLWVFRLDADGKILWEQDIPGLRGYSLDYLTPVPGVDSVRVTVGLRGFFTADVSAQGVGEFEDLYREAGVWRQVAPEAFALTPDSLTVTKSVWYDVWDTTLYWSRGGETLLENFMASDTFRVGHERAIVIGTRVRPQSRILLADVTRDQVLDFWTLDLGYQTLSMEAAWSDDKVTWLACGGSAP